MARQYHSAQIHYLRRDVAYNTSGISSGVSLGKIPANALVLYSVVAITTAFNAGTTNVLIVGTSGDDDALVAAADVSETTVASTRVAPATLGGLLSASADTELFAKYTQTGTAASAGAASVVVAYVLPDA